MFPEPRRGRRKVFMVRAAEFLLGVPPPVGAALRPHLWLASVLVASHTVALLVGVTVGRRGPFVGGFKSACTDPALLSRFSMCERLAAMSSPW